MSIECRKRAAAEAALDYIEGGDIVGVGTGSTANYFIDALARIKGRIEAAVASSVNTAHRLRGHGIEVLELNRVNGLRIYVDGADEATQNRHLIKGGGGALTREKIAAHAAETFICIADESKRVDRLGAFPLPVEVIPMAQSMIAREMVKLGGQPALRGNFTTDNGNIIIDVGHLDIMDPVACEAQITLLPGVVSVGLFARRGADVLLLGTDDGVEIIR